MTDKPRLIEHAFPLKQASIDSVHEKNVRHGHISTLHIWPARRPLAACRAALIATLLPDPGTPEKRKELCEKIGGKVVKKIEKKKMPNGQIVEREKEVTEGGILHWGRETENKETLDWFRQEIKKAYGGLPAPRPGKFFVYAIKCNDDSFYIGQTDNLPRRFEEHEAGRVQWTSTRKPLKVIHWEEYDSREEAVKREDDLKTGFGRKWLKREYEAGRTRQAGRAPKVLDPFAGGGAIPLEAMRLGCEVTAADINPVAWFILKCTLEYPQKLAGKTHPLPDFILENEEFMNAFYKAHPHLAGRTKQTKKQKEQFAEDLFLKDKKDTGRAPKADLAWHVRAWGQWVLEKVRRELAPFYPTYADFEPLDKRTPRPYEKQPIHLVSLKEDGRPKIDALNKDFSEAYLIDKRNPRWVAKPTVAYLWARTVTCKNCRATIPLLKTRWLCKKEKKRVLLAMEPNADRTGVVFGIRHNIPSKGGNAAQKREHDKQIGAGTISKAGAKCPCCGLPSMTMEDIRVEAISGQSGYQQTAIVVEGQRTKEYRVATDLEVEIMKEAALCASSTFQALPNVTVMDSFEPCSTRSISAQLYGVRRWSDLYTPRQIVSVSILGRAIHDAYSEMRRTGQDAIWRNAVIDYLCLGLDRLLCFLCVNACWKPDADSLNWAFSRFSISLLWDFAEAQPLGTSAGSYVRCNERIGTALDTLMASVDGCGIPSVINKSAMDLIASEKYDAIVTDPPYYQAVSYADLSDFSYTWLRGFVPELPKEFSERLSNKVKEAVQHIREDKSRDAERIKYENQMAEAFSRARESLNVDGRFICVFAHKEPDAWETLASAIIRSGFVVTGSWPIQDNLPTRQRASASAALASSVWIVCRPRPSTVKAGWDTQVLDDMRQNIRTKLREFWDAGIRGPDFVWAATGPALEAYSKHPVVKKADAPGQIMTVSEFLTQVRRIVVDFVVGRVLTGDGDTSFDDVSADRLDEPTSYYLLHRHDFGFDEAPAGSCILYAISCGLSDRELADTWDLIGFTKGTAEEEINEEESVADEESTSDPPAWSDHAQAGEETGSGSKVKLKAWAQRKRKSLGFEAPGGKPIPLIDRVHCLMHLWKAGDLHKIDEYLDENALRRQELFKRLLQSLIELSPHASEERSLLESISNHVQARGAVKDDRQLLIATESTESTEA